MCWKRWYEEANIGAPNIDIYVSFVLEVSGVLGFIKACRAYARKSSFCVFLSFFWSSEKEGTGVTISINSSRHCNDYYT